MCFLELKDIHERWKEVSKQKKKEVRFIMAMKKKLTSEGNSLRVFINQFKKIFLLEVFINFPIFNTILK